MRFNVFIVLLVELLFQLLVRQTGDEKDQPLENFLNAAIRARLWERDCVQRASHSKFEM